MRYTRPCSQAPSSGSGAPRDPYQAAGTRFVPSYDAVVFGMAQAITKEKRAVWPASLFSYSSDTTSYLLVGAPTGVWQLG
jgi:hypothetical protein